MKRLPSGLSGADVRNVQRARMVTLRAGLEGQKWGDGQRRGDVRKHASARELPQIVQNGQEDVRDEPSMMSGRRVRPGLGAALPLDRERIQLMTVATHHVHRASRSRRTSAAVIHAAPSLKAGRPGHEMQSQI